MSGKNVNVDQWVEMFRALGLEQVQMHRWHAESSAAFRAGMRRWQVEF